MKTCGFLILCVLASVISILPISSSKALKVRRKGERVSLLLNGRATTLQTFVVTLKGSERITSSKLYTNDNHIISDCYISYGKMISKSKKVLLHLEFNEYPGLAKYDLVIHTTSNKGVTSKYFLSSQHHVFGAVFVDYVNGERAIVSGQKGKIVKFSRYLLPQDDGRHLRVIVFNGRGSDESVSILKSAQISIYENESNSSFVLRKENVHVEGEELIIRPSNFMVSSGNTVVMIKLPSLALFGAMFETTLQVSVQSTTKPPPVVLSPNEIIEISVSRNGSAHFELRMANVRDSFLELEAVLSKHLFTADRNRSILLSNEQHILFIGTINFTEEADLHVNDVLIRLRDASGLSLRAENTGDLKARFLLEKEKNGSRKLLHIFGIFTACVGVVVVLTVLTAIMRNHFKRKTNSHYYAFEDNDPLPRAPSTDTLREIYGRKS